MQGQYNMRNPAVKRLMKEAQELKESTELYHAQPLEDNLFEWHFTLRGPEDSDFDGGIYHGRIILPPEYPMKPPSIILLTPNGRFETLKKICLSISGFHPESWQPSWSIRTALLAIIGFMPTHGGGAIGSLDYTPEERKVLAKKSQAWKCPDCGDVSKKLKPLTAASGKAAQEAKELASQINFQAEKSNNSPAKTGSTEAENPSGDEASAAIASSPPHSPTPPPSTPPPSATAPQPPFPYPWMMPPGWGAHPQQPSGASAPLAFPRFPYPPPFMTAPPGTNAHPQGMPFFPPPPPFFAQHMFRGFPPLPVQPGTATGGGATGGATSESSGSSATTVPASTTSQAPSQPVAAATSTPSSTASRESQSEGSPVASSPKTETVGAAATSTPAVTRSAAPTSSTTVTSETPPSGTATTTSANASTTTATTTAASAPETELRQRSTQPQPASPASASTSPPATSAPAPSPAVASYSPATLVLIVLLCLAITVLLGRRLYLMYFATKDISSLYD